VIGSLCYDAAEHSEAHFYRRRAEEIDGHGPVGIAAWMIYMNKAGFNGLYRVNRSGGFNVPWGKHATFTPDAANLRPCSTALLGRRIENRDFRDFIERERPQRGDVVYFDPPYVPLTATSNFDSYTKERFVAKDQLDLRDLARDLKSRGVHVILSNSAAPLVRDLYADGFTVADVLARRAINSKGSARGAIKELLIT
jgi:DNA adenine methylase